MSLTAEDVEQILAELTEQLTAKEAEFAEAGWIAPSDGGAGGSNDGFLRTTFSGVAGVITSSRGTVGS